MTNDIAAGHRSEETWCVVGAGAIGCAVAETLTSHGFATTLVARGDKVDHLRRFGVSVDQDGQSRNARPAIARIEELGRQDRLLLAVKAHDLPDLAASLRPLINRSTVVLPLVNGIPWWYHMANVGAMRDATVEAVDPGGHLRQLVPADQIVGCVVFTGGAAADIGRVKMSGPHHLIIGALAPDSDPGVDKIAAELTAAGMKITLSDRIRDHVWTKAVLNLATNPLSVLSGAPLGEHFTDPHLFAVVREIMTECWAAGTLHGISPTMDEGQVIAIGKSAAARSHRTSMEMDYAGGRLLEFSIFEGLAELAAQVGKRLPVSQAITDLARHRAALRRS